MSDNVVDAMAQRTLGVRMAPDPVAVRANIQDTVTFIQRSYYFWAVLWVVLGISAIILPALAAMGVFVDTNGINRVLAGSGAIAAAIFGFLKPDVNANNYDAAVQLAWATQIEFENGTIDNLQASDSLKRATDLMKGNYGAPKERSS